jgi:hypothetical protein
LTEHKQTSIRLKGQEVFSISRDEGGISVSARVISVDNKVIAQITKNEIYVNPSGYFVLKRPDWPSLIIEDPKGHQVLNVYYINPSTVRVLGSFQTLGGPSIIITQDAVRAGGITFGGGNCIFSNQEAGASIDLY